jgi:nicotinamidase-related amidase
MWMDMHQEMKAIVDPARTVLVVWDVQNMLVKGIFNEGVFLERANLVISTARAKGVPVVFSRITPLPERFESPVRKFMGKFHSVRMNPVPGGLDLTIAALDTEMVIPKHTASIFIGTDFERILRNAGITTIVFIGIATQMGIESSARDALNRSFYPVVVSDAVSSFNQEAHERSLATMANMMILMEASEIAALW